jgi:hypothetical protein
MRKKTQKKTLKTLEAISQHLQHLFLEAQKVNTSLRIIADRLEPPPPQPAPQFPPPPPLQEQKP